MYAYDSFWRIYERSGISANYRPFRTSRVNHNRFFTWREYDTDLQLYYYRARWYSPALGRFMSRDPLGYADGVNLYAYVGNNPVSFVDPWGLKASSIIPTESWEWKSFNEMTWWEVANKVYDNRDWEQLQEEYVDSAWAFSEPFVLTAECFQENVFVCSAETFTPYGDAVMINEYMNNYDSMTPTEKWVQGWIMVWAVLTPGNKKTNKWLVKKVDDVIKNFNNLWSIIQKNASHIFSKKHIRGGIMDLWSSQKNILNSIESVIWKNLSKLKEWDNFIIENINWHQATIKVFVENGNLLSIDAYKWVSSRVYGNVIK